ncbi:MAG: ShlB/FhaC/HecB family hemolysin secretion/activation protein [Pseudomonadota bacterium]
MSALTGQAFSQPAPQTSAAQEQRRAEERDRAQREQQERTPDVRLQTPAPAKPDRLPTESPCFVINQLGLKAAPGQTNASSGNWGWALDAVAGPSKDDSPLRRCIGAQGINLVLKRVQDAVVARGYVTTRVVAEPQDLASGALTFTIVPGRIGTIRFADGSSPRGTQWNAVPAKPGDILNLRDVEQALENFKRVPTAEADIQIQPSSGATALPGQSDLVISYQQAFPFRVSLFADDSGSRATGKFQGGITVSYDNWLTLNDLFYITLNRDLGGGQAGDRGTHGDTAHYSVPFGYWLFGATASNNRYRQSVAGVNQTYVYSGNSSNVDVKLSRLVYRDAARKTTLGLRAFQRSSSNFVDDTEIQVQRRIVGGFEASVNHREFIGITTLDLNLAYKRGTGAFGSLPAPEQATGEGTSRMQLTTLDATLNAPFKALNQNLRYTGTLRLQANQTPLTPQDRFAIGGRYTVRGFDGETSLSAERGVLLRNDLSVAIGNSGQEAYMGIDYGEVSGPSSDLLVGKTLAGAVLGLRGGLKNMQYDLFVGKPISKPDGFRTAQYTAGFSLSFSF